MVRKFLEGLLLKRGQEHLPEVSRMTDYIFSSSWEIVPEQCDEPLGSEVILPLSSDQLLEKLWIRSGLLMGPLEFVVLKCY